MKDWFDSLADRERVLVLTAAAMVVIAAFWFGVWTPLDDGQRNLSARVDTWRVSLAELRPLRGRIQSGNPGQQARAGQNQSLIVIVDNSLRRRALNNSLQRSQPTPAGDGIRIEFENVAFDDLMLWLGDINRDFDLQVQSGNFSTTTGNNPGRVNASLVLQR